MQVYGRSAWVYPPIPSVGELVAYDSPPSACGDVNNDGAVNALDLALVDGYMDGLDCPGLDINLNGVVDNADRAVILVKMMLGPNSSWCIGDLNNNGLVNDGDIQILIDHILANPGRIDPTHPNWDPIFDLDCNNAVQYREDSSVIDSRRDLLGDECPQ